MFVFLLIACYQDYREGKIKNRLILAGLCWGLYIQFSGRGLTGVLDFAEGFFGVFLLTYPLFKLGMLGAGDGKLFSVCAGAMGVNRGVAFLFCTFLVAAFLAVLKMLYHRNFLQRFRYFFTYAGQAVCTARLL